MKKNHKDSYAAIRSTSQLSLYNFAPVNHIVDSYPQQNQGASGKDIANEEDKMKTDQQPGYSQDPDLYGDHGNQEIGSIVEVPSNDIFDMRFQSHLQPQRSPYPSSQPKLSYIISLKNSTSIETSPKGDLDSFTASFDSSLLPSFQLSHNDDHTFFTSSTNSETSDGQSFWAPDINFWSPNNDLTTPVQYSYDTFLSQTPKIFQPYTQEQTHPESSMRYDTKNKTKQELGNGMNFGTLRNHD